MKVPYTTFSTYVVGTPTAKLQSVTQFKQGYEVKNDYWKRLREAIPRNHQSANTKTGLDAVLHAVSTSSKASNFALRANAYKKWWGNKTIVWTGGASRTWKAGAIDIGVNPELFVAINGTPHVIKLYFNKDSLPRDRANVLIRLMELTYLKGTTRPVVGVLDIGQGKLLMAPKPLSYLDPLLSGEAAAFAAVYNSLP